MPITDPSIPPRVLDCLIASGVKFAILHNEQMVGTPQLISDLDVAIASPVRSALYTIDRPLRRLGLITALRWPYDLGDTSSVFVTTPNGDEGAQIDLLHDPDGKGRYGIRTNVMLESVEAGVRYPVVSAMDQRLYLLRKGACKGQLERVDLARSQLDSRATLQRASNRANQLFSSAAAREMKRLLNGEGQVGPCSPRFLPNTWRRLQRAVRPIGLWFELIGPENLAAAEAALIEARFSRWMIRTGRSRRAQNPTRAFWFLRQVASVRYRAGLYVSWAEAPRRPAADLTLVAGKGIDQACSAIVEAMAAKSLT